MLLLTHSLKPLSIPLLQYLLERAWGLGLDKAGKRYYGGKIVGKKGGKAWTGPQEWETVMIACNITGVVRVYFESGEVQNTGGRITVDAGGECYEWLREWFRNGGRGVMVTYEGHSGCAVGAGEKGGWFFWTLRLG